MEMGHRKTEDQPGIETEALTFCWDDLSNNLMQSLQDLAAYKGVPPEVCLRLGDEEIMMHGVLLAGLSEWWRKRLDPLLQQETLIFHNIMVDFQPTNGVLKATRTLLYSGCVTIPSHLMGQVLRVTKSLNLDSHDLAYTVCHDDLYLVQWRGFKQHLLQSLQSMCRNQQCTDIYVVVKGHIIKAHKLVLGASSPVLNSAFQEDRRLRIIHLPDVSLKISQNLVTYMYYGKARVLKKSLLEFHKICEAFQVESLMEVTKKYAAEVSANCKKGPQPHVTIQARVRPEAKDLWGRLQQYYTVGRNADLMLVAENKRMLAHKTLFSAICPPIHEVLVQELSNEHAMVMITNTNYSLWEGILNIMYRGSCTIVGTAISTVFSYIDLSLFDIEVNEIPVNIECESDNKNIMPLLTKGTDVNLKLNMLLAKTEEIEQKTKKRKISEEFDMKPNDVMSEQNPVGQKLSRIISEDQNFILKRTKEVQYGASELDHKTMLNPATGGMEPDVKSDSPLPSSSSHVSTLLKKDLLHQINPELHVKEDCSDKRRFTRPLIDRTLASQPGIDNNMARKDAAKYFCEKCDINFKTEQLLLAHVQSHGIKILKRTEEVRNNGSELDHIKIENPAARGMIPDEKRETSLLPLSSHDNAHLKENLLYQTHPELHVKEERSEETRLTTPLIDRSLALQSGTDNNMRLKDATKYECEKCDKKFKTEQLLLIHVQSHGIKVKPYLCDLCDLDFHHLHSYTLHCRSKHKLQSPYECSSCGTMFSKSDKLKRHEEICQADHSKDPPLKNESSPPIHSWDNLFSEMLSGNQSTLDISPLMEMMVAEGEMNIDENVENSPQHNDEKYYCPDCGTGFKDIESLSAHAIELEHATVEESCWICGVCNNAFLKEEELTAHMKIHIES